MKACNQCGKCCKQYGNGGLTATAEEVAWWETFRPEISSYVSDGKIWMDPATGKQLSRCPWLHRVPDREAYECRIYHDRPDDCRHYPVTIDQMVKDECEMLEVRDVTNPQRAQKELDDLMTDSRPPVER
jgi:Fe-S-cluster containining protein